MRCEPRAQAARSKRRMSNSAHWSVDFVEHLRTVHFALVALAVALIILVSTPGSRSTSKALTQATQILEATGRWREVQKALFLGGVTSANPTSLEAGDVRHRWVSVNLPADPRLKRRGPGLEGQTLLVDFWISPLEVFAEVDPASTGPMFLGELFRNEPPRTLEGFFTWWDSLHAGRPAFIPDLSTASSCSAALKPQVLKDSQTSKLPAISCQLSDGPSDPSAGSIHRLFALTKPPEWNVMAVTVRDIEDHVYEDLANHGEAVDLEIGLTFPVDSVVIHESSLKKLFPDWREGPFEIAFGELASMPGELRNISLESVPARITSLEVPGEQVIEALGLKVPASELTRWGIILLLAAQFYFWLHLHEFNRKIARPSPGLDVAWIGVYRTRIAAMTVFMSSCILPVAAVATLLWRAWVEFRGSHIPLPTAVFRDSHIPLSSAMLGYASLVASAWLAFLTRERLRGIRTALAGASA